MSFTENELNIVLITIHRLAERVSYKKAISSEVLKETNIEQQVLCKILEHSVKLGYLQQCLYANVLLPGGGSISLALTPRGTSYVMGLNN